MKIKKFLLPVAVLLVLLVAGVWFYFQQNNINEKAYVAVGDAGLVAVIDGAEKQLVKEINLQVEKDDGIAMFMPHNVQVAPDGQTVWVTANNMKPTDHSAHGGMVKYSSQTFPDELVVIDTKDEKIQQRIPTKVGDMLAHVVLTPDAKYAYATAQRRNVIYKVNANSFKIEKEIPTPFLTEPHGLRISPDGKTAYLAMSKGKSLGILDLAKDSIEFIKLDGEGVQTAVSPDNKVVGITLYDTKKLAFFEPSSRKLSYLDLPGSLGPVQIYPSADSKYFYIADQGYYNGRPNNNKVYKVDIIKMKVVESIKVGEAPHGLVLGYRDKLLYVTNLVGNTVSIVESSSGKQLAEIPVGKAPNGISVLTK